jgi:hypothetical protein
MVCQKKGNKKIKERIRRRVMETKIISKQLGRIKPLMAKYLNYYVIDLVATARYFNLHVQPIDPGEVLFRIVFL